MVAAHPVQIGLVEAAADPPSPRRGRALGTERAGGAGARRGLVDPPVGRVALREEAQRRPAGTAVGIGARVVAEVVLPEQARALADLRQRDVGRMRLASIATMFSTVPYLVSPVTCRGRSFQRKRVRQRRSRAGWLSCTSAGVTKAVKDDPRLAPIDDVVVVVAQVRVARPLGGIGEASGSVVLTRKSAVRR